MIKNILFDCWSTLIRFKPKRDDWDYFPLFNHLLNKEKIDKNEVNLFMHSFYKEYYNSNNIYEIDNTALIALLKDTFNMEFDCSIEKLSDESLDYLDNKDEDNVNNFLNLLKSKKFEAAVASNTIYSAKKTKEIINKFINFDFKDIITSNKYGVRKPSPLFFNAVLNKLNFNKKETIYIGDSPIEDIYGPYLTGFKGAILVLNSKKDPSILNELIKDNSFKYLIFNNYAEMISNFNYILDYFS